GSAFEAWRYSRWSAQHIFVGAGTGDRDVDRIAAVLGGGGELTARDLDRMFAGHRSTQELRDRAVAYGVAAEVKRTTGGRPSLALTLAEKAEEADKALTRAWWTRPRFRFSASSATSAGGSL
ncbi:MAG: hypothetical protein ACXWWX_03400, partial [Actinomycetota bacterium]